MTDTIPIIVGAAAIAGLILAGWVILCWYYSAIVMPERRLMERLDTALARTGRNIRALDD